MPAATTERAAAAAAAPEPVLALSPARAPRAAGERRDSLVQALWWGTLAVAGVICFATFYAKGGLNLESMTTTEMVLTLGAGAVIAAAIAVGGRGRPIYGAWSLGLLLAFAALTALSVVWSVEPDASWHDAGRMFAYCAVFAAALALVRLAPERWPALIGGVVLAAVIVCGFALATKVFPGRLAPANAVARLEEPFGYWNAIGLAAAMGGIGCLWLGSRRSGHALLNALAYPAMGLVVLTLVLAYSRGALAAFAVGVLAWFCLVPLRLRGAAVLLAGALGAVFIAAWDFSRHALSSEHVPLADRISAGHQLGALTLAMLLALTLCGVAIGFATSRRAPTPGSRRRTGAVLLGAIVIVVLAFAGALAHSHRGLTGSVSHAVDALTNPNAKPPSNTPDRLTAVASVRARYWKEALQVFEAHPALGGGAEGYATAHLRYRTETLVVRHAHGFVVQTLADLGIVGLVLALALLACWMAAAGRATHPFNRRWAPWRAWRGQGSDERPGWRPIGAPEQTRYTPERVGLLSMLCLVIVFGAHSLIDWTWYVPGNACVALLCAGWLAGRGPLAPRAAAPGAHHVGPLRGTLIAASVLAVLFAAWSQWQPQRSEESRQEALLLLPSNPAAARAAAELAVSRDPLSAEALFTLADVQSVGGQRAAARATLAKAVRLQPSNPKTWLELGRFDIATDPPSAVREIQAAIYLNPESIAPEEIATGQREGIEIHNLYIQALRALAQAQLLKTASARHAPAGRASPTAARRRAARARARSRSRRAGG